jgi:hypothetical protein
MTTKRVNEAQKAAQDSPKKGAIAKELGVKRSRHVHRQLI